MNPVKSARGESRSRELLPPLSVALIPIAAVQAVSQLSLAKSLAVYAAAANQHPTVP